MRMLSTTARATLFEPRPRAEHVCRAERDGGYTKEPTHSCVLSDDSHVAEPTNRPDKIGTVSLTCPHLSPSAEPGSKRTHVD